MLISLDLFPFDRAFLWGKKFTTAFMNREYLVSSFQKLNKRLSKRIEFSLRWYKNRPHNKQFKDRNPFIE